MGAATGEKWMPHVLCDKVENGCRACSCHELVKLHVLGEECLWRNGSGGDASRFGVGSLGGYAVCLKK